MKNKKINKTIEKIHDQVKKFINSEDYLNYLKFIKKFHNRSFNNQFLIMLFKPHSKYVMGYKQWIDKFNRIPVACTECRAIAVKDCNCTERIAPVRIPQLAPIIYNKLNEKTQEEEERIFFKDVFVFDLEDTEPIPDLPIKPIEELVKEINIPVDFEKLEPRLKKIIEDNNFTLRYEMIYEHGLKGWTDFTVKEIVIKEQVSDSEKIHVLCHEIGHMFAHTREDLENMKRPRPLKECEAESIAFVIADFLNINTEDFSIPYITGWTKANEDVLQASVKKIQEVSTKIMKLLEEQGE